MTTGSIQLQREMPRRPSPRGNPAVSRALVAAAWVLSFAFDAAAADLPPQPAAKQAAIDAQVAPAQPVAGQSAVVPGKEPPKLKVRPKVKGLDGEVVRPRDGDPKKSRRPPPPPPTIDALMPPSGLAPEPMPGAKFESGEPALPAAAKAK